MGKKQFGGLRAWRGWFVGLTIGCLAAAASSVFLQGRALEQGKTGARDHAMAYASQVIKPELADNPPSGPITGVAGADLLARLKKDVLSIDETVARIRIWSPTGGLLFSTDAEDHVGQDRGADEDAIKAAVKGDGKVTTTLLLGADPVFTVYVPLRISGPPYGAVEVDDRYAMIEAKARQPWATARTLAVALAGVFGVLSLISFAPVGRSAAGRARGRAFIEDDGSGAARSPAPTNRETERMRSKLEKTEQGRQALEMELEQLRLQVDHGKAESAKRVAELEGQLKDAQTRLEEAAAAPARSEHETRVRELEEAAAAARAHAEEVEAKAMELTSQVTQSESLAQRLQAEAEAARTELASVGSSVAQADSKAAESEAKAAEAETAKAEMKARLDQLEEELRWSQAQQTETQPLLQEASARLQEAKTRADESLARATKMEERALDAEAAAAKLEGQLREAETRARELDDELEQTQARLRRAYAESEAVQAQLSNTGDRGEAPQEALDSASVQREVDRLTAELARTIERAHAAEEKGARIEAELVAMIRGQADAPSNGSGHESAKGGAGGDEPTDQSSAEPPSDPSGDEVGEEVWGVSEPSLRSRLARTAAQKKGRARGDDSPSSS